MTMDSVLAPRFSYRDFESIIISPLCVCLLHKYITMIRRAQEGMGKSSQREQGYSKCRDIGVHSIFFEEKC